MENGEEEEELDPRIQSELEKLNAATDGINHLETEFGEAQALFQQMMQDATFQLKSMNQELGKSVEKSRPYYEALKQARHGHNQLHEAALKFEQAQSRHYNAKKRVSEAERRSTTVAGKLDPALQEMLNQATIEVMEAATASQGAWEIHRAASIEFEQKQKAVQVLFKKINKHIMKSRPYFDMKYKWNKQLEIQKQRLEKIQEGITHSKNAYSDTLRNLEIISDDIHRSREEKRRSLLLGARGEGVGATALEIIENDIPPHDKSMDCIRRMSLDQLIEEETQSDAESTDSEGSTNDNLFRHDMQEITSTSQDTPHPSSTNEPVSASIPAITVDDNIGGAEEEDLTSSNEKSEASIEEETEKVIKETVEKIDSSYDVITSHSIEPLPRNVIDLLPELDITDSGRRMLNQLNESKRARSMTDLSSARSAAVKARNRRIMDISNSRQVESHEDLRAIDSHPVYVRTRTGSLPQKDRRRASFSIGNKPPGYDSPRDTPESRKRAIASFAALTIPALAKDAVSSEDES